MDGGSKSLREENSISLGKLENNLNISWRIMRCRVLRWKCQWQLLWENRLNRFIDLHGLWGHVDFNLTLRWNREECVYCKSIASLCFAIVSKVIAMNIKSMFTFFSVTLYDAFQDDFLVLVRRNENDVWHECTCIPSRGGFITGRTNTIVM